MERAAGVYKNFTCVVNVRRSFGSTYNPPHILFMNKFSDQSAVKDIVFQRCRRRKERFTWIG